MNEKKTAHPAPASVSAVEGELRRLAGQVLRKERPNHTLQPTALVNEAYLRLFRRQKAEWNSREHFMADAARAMRRVLVDYARARLTQKRSTEGLGVVSCDPAIAAVSVEVIDIHRLLDELAEIAPRQAQLVELRFFGGCSLEEAAAVIGIAPRTADKDWLLTRAWLKNRLAGPNRQSESAPA